MTVTGVLGTIVLIVIVCVMVASILLINFGNVD